MTYQDVVNAEVGGPCGQRSAIAPTLWCDKHDSRWWSKTTYCDVYDNALGLAQEVDEQARADERAKIAQAIEAVAAPYAKQPYPNREQSIAYRNAARIARQGGQE